MSELESNSKLFKKIISIIRESRKRVAIAVNSEITLMYWHIGKTIQTEVLNNQKPEYGKAVVASLSHQLTQSLGKGWSKQTLWNCLHIVEIFPEEQKISTLCRELTWSHIKILSFIKDKTKRQFYIQLTKNENWSVRKLNERVDSMLFERTAISKKPEKLIEEELSKINEEGLSSPDLVFRDPYLLNFLGLKDTYSEYDLESAIINEIQSFLSEMGTEFSFVARQKRITIDNEDHKIDLLFFHRGLKRLIVIDLKLGRFKAAYKGQMELYLKWIDKHDKKHGEESPIGLILCAEKKSEQIELLELDKSNIRVAEYITKVLPKEVLVEKLHLAIDKAKNQISKKEN